MKKIYLIAFLAITSLFVFGFRTNNNEHDSKLVGIWKGFEKDKQIEGVEKHWIQERFKDGSYVIIFTSIQNCEVETFVEKGKWRTKDGKFYESNENNKKEDIYEYEVVDNLMVNFKSVLLLGEKNSTYIFI